MQICMTYEPLTHIFEETFCAMREQFVIVQFNVVKKDWSVSVSPPPMLISGNDYH